MRIVITGATGFIGSNLAKLFLKKGAEVFVLVRPESTHLDVLPKDEKLHVVSCGLSNVMDCVSYIKEADAFFHLAWGGVNRQEIDSPEVQAKNVAGSLDCIRAAKALNCRMFMDAGSRVEYGLTDGFMQEDIECHPVNQYGKAKWEFYQKAVPLCASALFQCIWNRRPSLVYHFHSCAGTSSRKQGFFKRMQTSVELYVY